MNWEQIAEERLKEINRLRGMICDFDGKERYMWEECPDCEIEVKLYFHGDYFQGNCPACNKEITQYLGD